MITTYWRDIGGAAYLQRGKRSYTLIKQTNQVWRVSRVATVEKVRMSISSQETMGIPTVRVEYPDR